MDSPSGSPALRVQNHYVPLQTKSPKVPPSEPVLNIADHQCRVKAVSDNVIEPGFGQNIPVKLCYSKRVRKRLPAKLERVCYVLEPSRYHHDLFTVTVGGL